jgi:hypothetical protein
VKLTTPIIDPPKQAYEADIQTSDPSKQTKPPAYPFSKIAMSKSEATKALVASSNAPLARICRL